MKKVWASELAALLGLHRYTTRCDAFFKKLGGVDAVAERCGGVTEAQVLGDVLEKVPDLFADSADPPAKRVKAAKVALEALPPGASRTAAETLATRVVFTRYGVVTEDSALALFNAQMPEDPGETLDKSFAKSAFEGVTVVGRIDAVTRSGKVVEIKNRVHRFMGVPLYEYVQVQAYLFLTGTVEGFLVESFAGAAEIHVIRWDETFWTDVVVPGLRTASAMWSLFSASERSQNLAFVTSAIESSEI